MNGETVSSDEKTPAPGPRILPGTKRDMGAVNYAIAGFASKKAGADRSLNVFTTIGRNRRLFRTWIRFARELSQHGSLATADAELVILRIAHRCECDYEWGIHELAAAKAGLSQGQIDGVRGLPEEPLYSPQQLALLKAADELHEEQCLSDATWSDLSGRLSEEAMLELCMLVGNYEMVAMVLKSCRVEADFTPRV
jgi:alkylhydroperoxidase family enzyme